MNPFNPTNHFESGFNLRRFLILIALIFIFSYGLFNARSLIFGPSIEIMSPIVAEFETEENTVVIKGKVENTSFLSLNERAITIDTEGYFEETVLLSPSFNTIEIRARDRFKNEVRETLRIYLIETKPNSENADLPN